MILIVDDHIDTCLDREETIGTLENTKLYFRGAMKMKWGQYEQSGIVYFTGRRDNVIVGLGGSLKHVMGNEKIETLEARASGSTAVGMQRALNSELKL